MSLLPFLPIITGTLRTVNTKLFADGREIFVIGGASPLIPDLSVMTSQDDAGPSATNKRANQCKGTNADGFHCGRDNVTTTKKLQDDNSKSNKTDEEKFQDTLCSWCITKRRKALAEGAQSTQPSPRSQKHQVGQTSYSLYWHLTNVLFF